jgi:hypothetical protein
MPPPALSRQGRQREAAGAGGEARRLHVGHPRRCRQALFFRYQLTINAPLPEPDQAARAVGRHRFQSFIDQVGRNIAAGNRTLGRAEAMNGQGKDKP